MKCKGIVLGLALIIAMFLSGCGSKDTSPVSEAVGIEETVEVIGGEGYALCDELGADCDAERDGAGASARAGGCACDGVILIWADFETQLSATEALRPVPGSSVPTRGRVGEHLGATFSERSNGSLSTEMSIRGVGGAV